LPPDTAAFTGRGEELAAIAGQVTGAAQAGGVIAIHAIGGMPGVGKTALAVHVAHLLSSRFPARQLFIDLHAHTPGRDPVAPEDALAGLLTAAGVDPRFLPGDLEARTALWRDRMAGQRALLVLDNAASTGQVAPLLPGGRDCLVLVTSRRHLGDLAGVIVPVLLDALPPEQAQEMFTRLAPRAAADPAAVAEVVQLAGFLPLAVSLLAHLFARHPSRTLADAAAEVRESRADPDRRARQRRREAIRQAGSAKRCLDSQSMTGQECPDLPIMRGSTRSEVLQDRSEWLTTGYESRRVSCRGGRSWRASAIVLPWRRMASYVAESRSQEHVQGSTITSLIRAA